MGRPMGVTILAILALLMGLFGILGALAEFGLGGLRVFGGAVTLQPGAAGAGVMTMLGAFLTLFGAILSLAFGVGALALAGWAWSLGVVVMVIQLAGHVLRLLSGNTSVASVIGIIIAGGILFYLFRPQVRAAFGKSSAVV